MATRKHKKPFLKEKKIKFQYYDLTEHDLAQLLSGVLKFTIW